MRRPFKSLLLVGAVSLSAVVAAPVALGAEACPNQQLRIENNSTVLPDCRAYELVTPDINHVILVAPANGTASPDGGTLVYLTTDAPEHASSASIGNYVRATRDAVKGWSNASLSPPLSTPSTSYLDLLTLGLSPDLSSAVFSSDQPLAGGSPTGFNIFVGRPDGSFQQVSLVGTSFNTFLGVYNTMLFGGGTPDFRHVYFTTSAPQHPGDPTTETTYSWSAEGGVKILGILPGGEPSASGSALAAFSLPGSSSDGRYVAFSAENKLYVRIDEAHTAEVDATRRTIDPDPNPQPASNPVGITADGSKILFTSSSELTNDANTGESAGVADDAGRDLYSYDTSNGHLTDLTPDANPADAATGANIQSLQLGPIVVPTPDGSYIYFIATGDLAPGATPGQRSLYVSHEGHIDFVSDAENLLVNLDIGLPKVTPDGRHVAFASLDPLTGYDNTDPVTGLPHYEVFEASPGAGILCASCRADGTPPSNDSTLPSSGRVMSDDGERLFFYSKDAVLPQASSGLRQLFEYSAGNVTAISPLDGPPSASSDPTVSTEYLDASASGDDVFFATFDEVLANPNGGDDAVYDAHVGGGFPVASSVRCSGVACQAPPTPSTQLPIVASISIAPTDAAALTPPRSVPLGRVSVSKIKPILGTTGLLKVKVPGAGRLTISGSGLRSTHSAPSGARTITLRLALTAKAARALRARHSFKTQVRVGFSSAAGQSSTARLRVIFTAGPPRAGR